MEITSFLKTVPLQREPFLTMLFPPSNNEPVMRIYCSCMKMSLNGSQYTLWESFNFNVHVYCTCHVEFLFRELSGFILQSRSRFIGCSGDISVLIRTVLRTNSTWQVDTQMVLLQTKYILIPHHAMRRILFFL